MNMKQFQTNLNGLGFYVGPEDGVKGSKTIAGTKTFQKYFGLSVDGIVGTKTLAKMLSVTKQIQDKLKKRGFYKGTIDGLWGRLSGDATEKYQKSIGLVADRICGVKTRAKLAINGYIAPKVNISYKWSDYEYFEKEEFKCECNKYCNGYPKTIDKDLLDVLTAVRKKYGPVQITSGMRCQTYNDSLEGSIPNSKHIQGKAADFWISGCNKSEVLAYVKTLSKVSYAYTNESNMKYAIHVDVN